MNIIFKAVKQVFCLIWQSFFQPSKVCDFINKRTRNNYIFIFVYFFSGLLGDGH